MSEHQLAGTVAPSFRSRSLAGWRSFNRLLPRGEGLSQEVFEVRHRIVRMSLKAFYVFVVVVGLLTQHDRDFLNVIVDLLPLMLLAVVAMRWRDPNVAKISAALTMMLCATILVHATGGAIEAHFSYFVTLPLIALYQDWRPFMAAVGFVLVSHVLVGTALPGVMYNHESAIDHPFRYALIHGGAVLVLVVVMLINWRFAEVEQHRTRSALNELQATQKMLVQAEKLESIGSLAAGVAHEINTPVQYIADNTTFLAEAFGDLIGVIDRLEVLARTTATSDVDNVFDEADVEFLRAEVPRALEQSQEGLGRVSEIVRAMKDFSHPGSELATADLNKAVASTVTISRNEWKYVATVDLQLADDLPLVACHEGEIKQVVLNLVVNAAHAIGDQRADGELGRIVVSTSVCGEMVRISVADDGCGMPPDVVARIFDPFFTTKGVGRGTGQGLSVAHRIVAAHHGTISVETAPGRGATFNVDIPILGPLPGGAEQRDLDDELVDA